MSAVRRNILANYAGKGLLAAMALFFPPFYLRLLGAESYGLVGFFGTLTAVLNLFDFGLSMTLNREMARLSAEGTPEASQEMRDLVRTHEGIFWAVGLGAGLVVFALAPLIAHRWVHVRTLPVETVTQAVRVMGLIFALQWPGGLYNGGLLGLQQQVLSNVVQVATSITRLVGSALILWFVSRTVQGFLLWQVITASLGTIACGAILARHLPARDLRGRFRWDVVRKHWRFSAGMSGISIMAIVLVQADKLVVGKLFTLDQLGYYTLAGTVGNGLYYFIGPVFAAVFPRLCQLVTTGDEDALRRLYHKSCQIMSVTVLPVTLVLVLFVREVLFAWTGNPGTVERIWRVVVAIAIGTSMSGLMNLPYALQLAHGWTRLTFWTNLVAVLLIVPLVATLGVRFGMVGAAAGWMVLNAGYVLVCIRLMHRRLLRGEMWRWYLVDVGMPLAGALLVVTPFRYWLHVPSGRLPTLLTLMFVGAMTVVGAGLAAPAVREMALSGWRRRARA